MGNRGLLLSCAIALTTAAAACSLFYSLDGFQSAEDAGTAPDAVSRGPEAATPDIGDAAGDASSFEASLPEGLIAHWPFEGSATDATGKGHTLLGVKTVFVDGGVRGGAVRCPEIDSHLETTSPDLQWGSNGVTVIAWVKLESADAAATRTIFESGRNADWTNSQNKTLGFGVGQRTPQQGVSAHVADGGASSTITVTAPPDDGKFHTIAFVGSRSAAAVYVDGISGGLIPLSDAGSLIDPAPFFQLCGHGNGNHYLNGLLDEVMVWNRALSAGEITSVTEALRP